jgi:hypothetical protein
VAHGLLSVIVPTHNRPDRLERAAKSVLEQDGPEIELVIVDDASDDDTPATTARLAEDPRVRVVRNPESLGPAGARNRGIEVARGELLGFCDDDDTWSPGAASILAGCFDAEPELVAVSAWHRVVHDANGRTAEFRSPGRADATALYWLNVVALPFGVVRRTRLPAGPLFDERLPPCEDWDLWLRCALIHPVRIVPIVLYEYHQHGGSRVTDARAGTRGGHQALLDKHADAMSAACRLYHRAIISGETGGRPAMRRTLAGGAKSEPAAAAIATAVLAAGSLTAAIGIARGDPGFPARATAAMVTAHSMRSTPTPPE